MTTLIVQLTSDTPIEDGPTLIRSILGDDAETVEQLFPGDTQRNLASLFTVALGATASAKNAIGKLTQNQAIEYAHTPQERQ